MHKRRLENLLVVPAGPRRSQFDQLRSGPVTISGPSLVRAILRLKSVRDLGMARPVAMAIPPSRLAFKAFTYLLSRWETLTQFLRLPGAPLDNNTVERALKLIIRQRKNSLFYASAHSATVASLLTSLIATCVQAGVNALEYLVALQTHRAAVGRQPAAWLPWNYHENVAPA